MSTEADCKEIFNSDRLCPKPQIWVKVYQLIEKNSEQEIMKPIILGAQHFTSDEDKKDRFLNHLAKASELGIINEVKDLVGDSEINWHHENE